MHNSSIEYTKKDIDLLIEFNKSCKMKNIEEPKKEIHINQIDPTSYKKLKDICRNKGISINNVMRLFIEEIANENIIPVIIKTDKMYKKNKLDSFIIKDQKSLLPF